VKGFLLDTNIPSELTYPQPAPQVAQWLENTDSEELFFSVISLAEICKGISKLPESKKRAQLQAWLDSALEHELTLVTRNVKDFAGFGVAILNPWES
jgi:predicted nucleic acid-binding protein